MLSIEKIVQREFAKARERKWRRIYIAVDFHDVVFVSNYKNEVLLPVSEAVPALQYLSIRQDIVLIAFTSTSEKAYEQYRNVLNMHNINFQFLNSNPLETGNEYADFSKKFYFNIMLDDKAGFDWKTDWTAILEAIKKEPQL